MIDLYPLFYFQAVILLEQLMVLTALVMVVLSLLLITTKFIRMVQ